MRILTTTILSLLIVSSAFAQEAAPVAQPSMTTNATTTQPMVTTPPTAVVVKSTSPQAVTTPVAAPVDLSQQLQKVMSSKQGQQNLGPMLAVGTLLNCTQKKSGKDATQAFYAKVQTVTKAVHEQCKAGNPAEAKKIALAAIDANANDPVAKSALGCYDTQRTNLEGLAGQEWAGQASHYVTWVRNPKAAHQQITDADVCRNQATAAPVQGVN